jgi:WD40 repeat protein
MPSTTRLTAIVPMANSIAKVPMLRTRALLLFCIAVVTLAGGVLYFRLSQSEVDARERLAFNGICAYELALSSSEKYLAAAGFADNESDPSYGAGLVVVLDLPTKQEVFRYKKSSTFFLTVAFSPDGTLLAAGEDGRVEKAITIWEVPSFKQRARIITEDTVAALRFRNKQKELVAIVGGRLQVWDTARFIPTRTLKSALPFRTPLLFSPDDSCLAIGTLPAEVGAEKTQTEIRRTTDGAVTATLNVCPHSEALAFYGAEDSLIYQADWRTIDLARGLGGKNEKHETLFAGGENAPRSGFNVFALSSDGKCIYSDGCRPGKNGSGLVLLTDMATRKTISLFATPGQSIRHLLVTKNQETVITSGSLNSGSGFVIKIWSLTWREKKTMPDS